MVIHFEGLSGAGKTTILSFLEKKGYSIVPEFVLKHHNEINLEICKKNDITKCIIAKKLTKNSDFVLVDRGYMSTLVYETTKEQVLGDKYQSNIKSWYCENINLTLIKPDLYLYIDVSINKMKERIEKRNTVFIKEDYWLLHPNLIHENYMDFFKTVEPDIPVEKISNEKNIIVNNIIEIINKYK